MSVAHRTLECPVFFQTASKEEVKKLHHPLKFSEVSNKSKVVTATVQYSPFCAAVDESIDEPQPHSNMAASESNQFNFVGNHRHKRQKCMTDFQRLDDQAFKRTTDSVTKFLVCTMQPYNLVDRKEFINMVKVLNPRYSLPGRKHFTATAVPKLYNEVRDKIRQELSLIKKDTISVTDYWTSIANTPYITITVHFITSEWALKSACLACAHFDDDHNGKNIAEVLRSILNDWGIDVQNIMSITTDNGRNILKSIEELNLENAHISCFAHNINIGVNHSLDIPILKRAIAQLKKLQNTFAMRWKMKRDLHKAQELLQMEVKTLPSACPTRWWSTLKLVKRFLENQLPICKTLLEYPNKKHLMLEGNEISALEDFTTATELLEDITSSLSGEQYTTASAVLPLYMKIKNNLQNKDEDSSLLKSIKSEILESLNKYQSHPMSSNLQLSTLCDPRFRL
ncbi:zinc finger BED domain-containing protein 4 [Trichonephila inaurata madagascariensis]|uniref:Zinc finger BED domain-containing protein 4 n=1 Tax=Trichonephila inaurata madagascariensis TaxID=2747483 RepID=A0A8X6XJJ2_9ARAC|nr:zinc finger BED domain-containing protein 4 [Trichonephila inaurata madagascariensis]